MNRLTVSLIISRIAFFCFFSIAGYVIIVIFSPYRPLLQIKEDLAGRVILIAVLVLMTWLAGKFRSTTQYREAMFGLLVLAVTVTAVWIFACFLLHSLEMNIDVPSGFSLLKLGEFSVIVVTVLLLTKASGGKFASVYVAKGNLKKGLSIGIAAFLLASAGSIFVSPLFFGASGLNARKVIEWLPWILIFIFANAAGEELLFRGLFLKKLEPLYGSLLANLIIAFVFTALHLGVTYPKNQLYFLMLLVPLALIWGFIIQKTNSLIASVLFHAGMDVAIILGIFSNL